MNTQAPLNELPLKRGIKVAYMLSLTVVFLMTAASGAGLVFPDSVYPTAELRESFLVNDAVNLIIGLPILLGMMWLARRGRLAGLLYWPGALLYIIYNYLIYSIGIPSNWFRLLGLLLVGLSIYTLVHLIGSINGTVVQQQLTGSIPERFTAGILMVFGVAFLLRAISIIAGAVINQSALPITDVALNISDIVLSVLWIVGGVLLWWRKTFGYETGPGLLFQGSMLFIGLIMLLLLDPALTGAPFLTSDLIAVGGMSLIFLIPFTLVTRGIAAGSRT